MKKLSLLLNGILIIAVAILFYLHFSQKPQEKPINPVVTIEAPKVAVQPNSIAFVNTDSLLNKYEFFKKIKADLEAREKKIESELIGKEQALRNEIMAYQQKAGSMTQEQRQSTEEGLARKEQEYLAYKEKKSKDFIEEQQKQNELLYTKITDYLKRHAKDKFKYVLGYTKEGNILYANDSLNITQQVMEGLNAEYTSKNKK